MSRFSVLIAAGGSSRRFGTDKLLAGLVGRPVIARTVDAFLERDDVAEVVIATGNRAAIERVITPHGKLRWCAGGETRAHTVRNAAEAATGEWVAVHDAARPLVSPALLARVFEAALAHGAAAPALPVHLTIKRAVGPLPAPVVTTVPRHDLWAMQTPQVMRRDDLLAALDSSLVPLDQLTDDLQALELAGMPVVLVEGEDRNLKITRPFDLALASLLLTMPDAQ